jgi:hypothetical protein
VLLLTFICLLPLMVVTEMSINWATHGDNSLTTHDNKGAIGLDVISGNLKVSA